MRFKLTETMYWFYNECQATLSLYAKEQRVFQVPGVEIGSFNKVWISGDDIDRLKYSGSYDEGKFFMVWALMILCFKFCICYTHLKGILMTFLYFRINVWLKLLSNALILFSNCNNHVSVLAMVLK